MGRDEAGCSVANRKVDADLRPVIKIGMPWYAGNPISIRLIRSGGFGPVSGASQYTATLQHTVDLGVVYDHPQRRIDVATPLATMNGPSPRCVFLSTRCPRNSCGSLLGGALRVWAAVVRERGSEHVLIWGDTSCVGVACAAVAERMVPLLHDAFEQGTQARACIPRPRVPTLRHRRPRSPTPALLRLSVSL